MPINCKSNSHKGCYLNHVKVKDQAKEKVFETSLLVECSDNV